ncbi:MAG: hypothetical protein Q3M30_05430 [Candidatus Electrothrix sp. Rat3]|nr:hypothetical protein [Candidatus Electrothrix rattekaaiensis]
MSHTSQQFIRMSGTDQVVWNLVDDTHGAADPENTLYLYPGRQ